MLHDSSSIPNGSDRVESAAADMLAVVAANVRRLREAAGWSLGELARRSQVAKSTLSTIELAAGNPGLETLVAISVALGVPFGALLTPRAAALRVQRAGEGPEIVSAAGSFVGRLVATTGRAAETECYRFRLEPPQEYRAESHPAGVTEVVICLKGRLRVGPVVGPALLGVGDRATFGADQPHLYQALGRPAELLIVLSYPFAGAVGAFT